MKWSEIACGDHWLLSPRLSPAQKKLVQEMKSRVPLTGGTLWILSSGTQSVRSIKAIGLSQSAVLASAESVNRHLARSAKDHWLLALPTYHVGGLGILARAFLSGAPVTDFHGTWDAKNFVSAIEQNAITLTSLVPTQVHDLVTAGLQCPASVRAVVIGGGALTQELYFQARRLNWPVLPSYGLSECASQVATAALDSLSKDKYPMLKILPHVQVAFRESRIHLRSNSLTHLVAVQFETGLFTLEDPLRDGWYGSEDLGEAVGNDGLRVLGRRDEIVKVLGELVSLPEVEARARSFFYACGLKAGFSVLALPAAREGHRLILFYEGKESLKKWQDGVTQFNQKSAGPERVAQLCWVPKIPRGDLGKVKKQELLSLFFN